MSIIKDFVGKTFDVKDGVVKGNLTVNGGAVGMLVTNYADTVLAYQPSLFPPPAEITVSDPANTTYVGFIGSGEISTIGGTLVKSATNYTFSLEVVVLPGAVGNLQTIEITPWSNVFPDFPSVKTTIPSEVVFPQGIFPNIIKVAAFDNNSNVFTVEIKPTENEDGLIFEFTPESPGNLYLTTRFVCGVEPM